MSLFRLKKKKETPKKKVEETKKVALAVKKVASKKPVFVVKPQAKNAGTFAHILVQPRITEKATIKAENGVYVFKVKTDATKKEIGNAVKYYYNVTPVKINIAKISSKLVSSRKTRKKGVKTGGKKAYVYLKEGDKLEIV